jgi:hypothetical protein
VGGSEAEEERAFAMGALEFKITSSHLINEHSNANHSLFQTTRHEESRSGSGGIIYRREF